MSQVLFCPRREALVADVRPDGSPRGAVEVVPEFLVLHVPNVTRVDVGLGMSRRYWDYRTLSMGERNELFAEGELAITEAAFLNGLGTDTVPVVAYAPQWGSRMAEFAAFDAWVRAKRVRQYVERAPDILTDRVVRESDPVVRLALLSEIVGRVETLPEDIVNASANETAANAAWQALRPPPMAPMNLLARGPSDG